jgi:Mrp family chromosome partitioning ATPase
VNLLADAALLGAAADGVIIVVRAGKTDAEALRFAMDQLTAAHAPLVGTLLNDINLRRYAHDDGAYRYLKEAEKYHGERV